jgi:hypothetical protein
MRWVKSSPSLSANAKKETGRKQLSPKSSATTLPQESLMKLVRFMSQGQRRRPCSSTSGPKLTRSTLSLPVYARICAKSRHPETSEGARGTRRDEEEHTYAVNMLFQLLDGMVSHGGLPFDKEAVRDRASTNGSRLCGRAPDGDEGLHGGGDELGVGVVAYRPVDVLHCNVAIVARPEGEVDAGDTHGSVGLAVNGLPDEILRQGLTHSDGPAILDPSIGSAAGLVDERDAAEVVGVTGLSSVAALLDDRLGVQQVDGLAVGVNDELDLRHGGD